MLDPHRFAVGVEPTKEQLKRVMVRRMKSELPPLWNGEPRFPKRVPHALEIDHSDSAREAYAKLTEYARSRRTGQAEGKAGRTAADFLTTLLKKRFLSSPKHTPEAKRRRAAARRAKANALAVARAPQSAEEAFADGLFPQPDALF